VRMPVRASTSLWVTWSLPLVGAEDAPILSRVGGPSFTAVEQRTENACLVEVNFWCSQSGICFPRLSWSIWTWCRWLWRFLGRFLSQVTVFDANKIPPSLPKETDSQTILTAQCHRVRTQS